MAYADLTAAEQATLDAFMQMHRSAQGQKSRLLCTLSQMQDAWTGGVSTIFGKLAAGDLTGPASQTGLAGAAPMLKSDAVALLTDDVALLSTYNTAAKRAAYIQAAGLPNVL